MSSINIQASQKSEVLSAIGDIKRSCGSSYSQIKQSIKQSENLKSTIVDLQGTLRSYSGYSSAKSSLSKAKENIDSFLYGANKFKNEMYWCDDFDVYALYDVNDAINEYNRMVKKVQKAQSDFSSYSNYYNKSVEYYNSAIKEIKK